MARKSKIEQQAELLASENRRAEPAITKIYWFPDPKNEEVRLIELTTEIPATPEDEELSPFYFRASPEDGMTVPTAILLIRPEEFRKRKLPKDWGGWKAAKELKNGTK